jgi:hypothetical protein
MAADRSDDAADQPDERPDHPADRPNPPADHANQSRRDQIEPRSRQEAYDAQRATESPEQTEPASRSEPGARSKPPENAHQAQPGSSWEETKAESRWMWGEYKRHFPPEERPPVDTSKDPPGSWRADAGRYLNPHRNQRIEAECDRIANREKNEITPALRAIESLDPHRHLVGLERSLKGNDRIKEKVYDNMKAFRMSPEAAAALVPDAIRFTFQYEDAKYTQGVYADTARLQEQGFKMEARKNSWSDDQYKGINSQWIDPVSGQRFEVQFHTRISYEAKQLTHPAYERIRALPKPDKFEQMILEAFQKRVTAEVPIPPGAADIPNHVKRGPYAR